MATYIAITPDNQVVSRTSKKPLTYGIAHYIPSQGHKGWAIASFSSGTRATAEKRMKSLQKFYGGEWTVVEATQKQDDN
jgi:hypothetical protein